MDRLICGSCVSFNAECPVSIPNTAVGGCPDYKQGATVIDISKPDAVNHPSHYTQGGIECIKAIEASMTPEGFQDYCKGNVLKYVWRWRDKAGVEDLKKAQVYLGWLIESAQKDQIDRENENGQTESD